MISANRAQTAALRQKFGSRQLRSGLVSGISERDAAFAAMKSARRKVQTIMRRDPRARKLLGEGDFMRYGFILDHRVKSRLFSLNGPRISGLRKNVVVYNPNGRGYVKGNYRVPDFAFDGAGGLEYWDLKPAGFTWNAQFQDILDWTTVRPLALGYMR